jgi:hypothetical protein
MELQVDKRSLSIDSGGESRFISNFLARGMNVLFIKLDRMSVL